MPNTASFRKYIVAVAIACCAFTATSAQWTTINTGFSKRVYDVCFADAATAYAVGEDILLKSTDGGSNWTDILPNLPALTYTYFDGICFLSKDTGFIFRVDITGDPTILKTNDGGQSWTDVSSPNMSQGVKDMYFVNGEVGYASGGVGAGNFMTKTIDGGVTWNPVTLPTVLDPSQSVCFLNELVGFAGYDVLRKTVDGAGVWNSTTGAGTTAPLVDYYFFDGFHGLAITYDWQVYRTYDEGDTWTVISTPYTTGGYYCRDMAFQQNRYGYAVGRANQYPLTSADSGNTWQPDPGFPPGNKLNAVAANDSLVLVACDSGRIMRKSLSSTGISTPGSMLNDVHIYPNPSAGLFTVLSEHAIAGVKVYNVYGQCILKALNHCNTISMDIDMRGKAAGTYFLQVDNGKTLATKPLTIQ